MNNEMYKEYIIDLYKHPNNFGDIKNATHKSYAFNTLCGDEIKISLILKNNKVEDIKFLGKGCAISIAAASLVTDYIKGKTPEEINKLTKDDIVKMLNIPISHVRLKCALHSLDAIKSAINNKNNEEYK